MKKFLIKIGLIKARSYLVKRNISEFESILRSKIDQEKGGFLSNATDVFSNSNNSFKGQILNKEFSVQHRRTFTSGLLNYPLISGKYHTEKSQTKLEITIHGLKNTFGLLLIMLLLGLLVNTFMIILFVLTEEKQALFQLLLTAELVLTLGVFMIYFVASQAVKMVINKFEQTLFSK